MILRSNCNSNFVNVSAKVVLFYKICKHISRFLIIIVIECDIQGRRQLYTIGSGLVISAEQFPLHRHEKWGGVTIVTNDISQPLRCISLKPAVSNPNVDFAR